ncbi:MAG: hypothetical protein GC196_14985 [Hyphomonas sp.]|nr:hypothetical protein [Hyphomonas sp.]
MSAFSPTRLGVLAAVAAAVLSATASGQTDRQPSADQRAEFEARLDKTRDRLGLTPEQEEAVRPI